ncbi:MAG: hypothetical protein ACOYOP_15050 [Microthrixaceae bacterium]
MKANRVLVVGPCPAPEHDDPSIDLVVDRLARAGSEVGRWYLFPRPHQPHPAERVVDDLRAWWPSQGLSAVGLGPVAGRLRGLRLRSWFREVDPDVVILDDEVGGRLLGSTRRRPRLVARPEPTPDAEWAVERRSCPPVDAVLVPARRDAERGTAPSAAAPEVGSSIEVVEPPAHVLRHAGAAPSEGAVSTARERAALPAGVPLLAGWGEDGWLDGPDLMVRVLWVLEHHHGRRAHGVWFGLEDRAELRRLESEADRCGVRDRFHLRPLRGPEAHLAGDVVVLPLRCDRPGLADELAPALLSGARVVTFPTVSPVDDSVEVVPVLDVAALAAAADRLLAVDRGGRRAEVVRRWDGAVAGMVDGILGWPR